MKWFTKTVTVDMVVDRVVLGEAAKANLYAAYIYEKKLVYAGFCAFGTDEKRHLGYYLSCADAFKAHPGCKVEEVAGVCIGAEYFAIGFYKLVPATVTKPKRGKGKA